MKNKQRGRFWQILMVVTALTAFGGAAQSVFGQQIKNAEEDAVMSAFDQMRLTETEDQNRISLQTKLTANDAANDDNFGKSVAIVGDTAIVGSWLDNVGANADQGSVYVFTRGGGGWTFQQKLTASDGAAGDFFGCSVAVAEANAPGQTVLMIGAFGDDIGANTNQGSVYVFVRNSAAGNFSQQGKINASDGATDDAFGASVAMTGSFTIIGANGDDIGSNENQGAAYIFVRSGSAWLEEQKLVQTTNSGAAVNANFGWSVAISGTTAVVGTNYTVSTDGRIVIFERVTGGNTWVLTASSGPENNGKKFGYSVGISGETIIVGSPNAAGSNPNQGEARIIDKSGGSWSYGPILTAPDATANDYLGASVTISGNTIIVGAENQTVNGIPQRGSAYVFGGATNFWTFRQKLIDSSGATGDKFGNIVAVSRGTIIVGAWQDDVGSLGQAGSASIFLINAPFDFDGDGSSDISVFRPSNGAWYVQQSASGFTGVNFGLSTDIPVPADYDGDGKTDVAVFRDGNWYYLKSSNGAFVGVTFGLAGDVPRPGDYDGDGKADINVFRPSTGNWFRLNSSNGALFGVAFGSNGDKALIADFDGDNKSDVTVFRPSTASFYWLDSSNGNFRGATFGIGTDIPTLGDYDGDGKTDVSVFRASVGGWYRLNSSNGAFVGTTFGQNGDIPVAADYDGDGRTDIAVFRNGNWYYLRSSNGSFFGMAFGLGTDKPIPAAFNQ